MNLSKFSFCCAFTSLPLFDFFFSSDFLWVFDLDEMNLEKEGTNGRAFFQRVETGDILKTDRIMGQDWWINATATGRWFSSHQCTLGFCSGGIL